MNLAPRLTGAADGGQRKRVTTTLTFGGDDARDLLEILIQAVDVTRSTGARPRVRVGGRFYEPFELSGLVALLPGSEIQSHHLAMLRKHVSAGQKDYRSAGIDLINLA